MMRNVTVIGVIMIALLIGNLARADACEIVNGSFEDDGWITNIESRDPNGWEVNISPVKFGGYVYTDWATDGIYSLTVCSDWAAFSAGDMATVSQDVNLVDVVLIAFDVKLATGSSYAKWDPNICTAVLLIDGDVVWDSNSAGLVAKGEYPVEVYVEKKYRTEGLQRLSLGIRVNVDKSLWETYYTSWDAVDCNSCPGSGFVKGDISGDCYVDANDLKILADLWLSDEVDPNDPANLSDVDDDPYSYAIIDFRDFAIFSLIWDGDMTVLKDEIAFNWLLEVDPDYEYNLFGDDDIRPRGEINFFDIAVLGDNWLKCGGGGE